jgi:hypothetical protein
MSERAGGSEEGDVCFDCQRDDLDGRRAGDAQRRPHRTARRDHLLRPELRTGDRRFEAVLEALSQRRSAAKHTTRERQREGGAFVGEELSSQRARVEHQLFDGERQHRVRAKIA